MNQPTSPSSASPFTPIESPFPSQPAPAARPAGADDWWPLPPPWSECRRDGDLVVAPRECMLPPRCVKCGAPSSERLTARLHWHSPGWYLLLLLSLWGYLIAALIVRKRAILEVGMCEHHARRRRRGRMTGWMIALAGLGTMFVATPLAILGGLVAMLTGLVVAMIAGRLVVAKRIDDVRVWLGGVHPAIVRDLPPAV